MAVDGTMKAWLDASRSQIERGTLAALREHVSDNSGILPPFRLPALARDIVHEMTRFLADEPARSGADAAGAFGEALAGLGLGLRSWLAVGRALARELVGDGATDRTALQIRLHEFVTWAVDGIARHQMAAISRQRDEMHAALERVIQAREDELRRVIQELSTPVIPVHRKILVLPLIGAVDDERARRITERLLEETARRQARIVIIDVTGLATCDAAVLGAITGAIGALRLLGARAVLAGIRPSMAEIFADLDVDFSTFVTVADLQIAIEWALRQLGLAILPRAPVGPRTDRGSTRHDR